MFLFWINYFLICVVFYLIGSIPFAYIIIKKKYNISILEAGTGNSGAMNVYDVTKSKLTGFLVFLLDFLKGLLPSLLLLYGLKFSMMINIAPLIFLVLGHNFSIWLKFKGGRGLSTSAGIYSAFNILFVFIWLIIYFISYLIKRNVHIGSTIATVLLPVFPIIFRDELVVLNYNYTLNSGYMEFFIMFSCLISLVILTKHIEPLIIYFKKTK